MIVFYMIIGDQDDKNVRFWLKINPAYIAECRVKIIFILRVTSGKHVNKSGQAGQIFYSESKNNLNPTKREMATYFLTVSTLLNSAATSRADTSS